MVPVSGSISTSAMWQPFGKVQALSLVVAAASSPPSTPSAGHGAGTLGKLHDVDRPVGAGDAEGALLEGDVGGGRLEHLRGVGLALLDHGVRRVVDRHPLCRQRARAAGPAARGDPAGVALDDADLLERHIQPVVQHLGIGRLVALAVGLGADQHRDRPVRLEAHGGVLGRVAHGRFDVIAHADAALAGRAPPPAACVPQHPASRPCARQASMTLANSPVS